MRKDKALIKDPWLLTGSEVDRSDRNGFRIGERQKEVIQTIAAGHENMLLWMIRFFFMAVFLQNQHTWMEVVMDP